MVKKNKLGKPGTYGDAELAVEVDAVVPRVAMQHFDLLCMACPAMHQTGIDNRCKRLRFSISHTARVEVRGL
jgi:hypothetical protein